MPDENEGFVSEPGIIRAPFTSDQVASLNACQASGRFHGFMCFSDACPALASSGKALLVAGPPGWSCPADGCAYVQDWAHPWMGDWTWSVGRDLWRSEP